MLLGGCDPQGFEPSDVGDAPEDPGPPMPPGTPPSGQKWMEIDVDNCGRDGVAWVLIDEVCGAPDDPAYLDYFRAPMFRDGARIGEHLFVVDATHLWVLEVDSDELSTKSPVRVAMTTGLGEPLAVGQLDGRLFVAAGSRGLLELDVDDPLAPKVVSELDLPGPALDVFVENDRAWVALGEAGIASIDLSGSPRLLEVTAVPGFAAGVQARDELAYVASCDGLSVVDLTAGEPLGQTWIEQAYEKGFLVAPAKDVALVDDVAFVAAGRYGAVAIDVSDPAEPELLGHCTIDDDPRFYASGVRAQGDTLYVAGGEWGVLPIDVSDPRSACTAQSPPMLPELPEPDSDECTTELPWEVVPWVDVFVPPPPAKDPVQTLPDGERLYAFGDARRIGVRAVDVRDTTRDTLPLLSRYQEPRLVSSISAKAGRVLVTGDAGGLFLRDELELLIPSSEGPATEGTIVGGLLDDGRWVVATRDGELLIEDGEPTTLSISTWSGGLAVEGSTVALPSPEGLTIFDLEQGQQTQLESGARAELPAAITSHAGAWAIASPEWTRAAYLDAKEVQWVAPHDVFELDDVLDIGQWRLGLPRRVLASSERGLVEVASLGHRAGLVVHGDTPSAIPLPPGTYVDAVSQGEALYLVSANQATFRSQLMTVSLSGGKLKLESVQAFTGLAAGVAVDGDRLYVADANVGVRVYELEPSPDLLGIVESSK